MPDPVILWLRRDLRLHDNPALQRALKGGSAVLPVYIFNPSSDIPAAPGAAGRWWLHHSLAELDKALRAIGNSLLLLQGNPAAELARLSKEVKADRIIASRRYEPHNLEGDRLLADELSRQGIDLCWAEGNCLMEPWKLRNKSGKHYRVFTPFWKEFQVSLAIGKLLPKPRKITPLEKIPSGLGLAELGLLPRYNWTGGLRDNWTPGEKSGRSLLKKFLAGPVCQYPDTRDLPGIPGTSRISPHLHFGELSVREAWLKAMKIKEAEENFSAGISCWLRQLAWREFSAMLLYHQPQTVDSPLDRRFRRFPWRKSKVDLAAWQKGKTGYPLVDAGMRELWHTGWMHNRVRMVVASFLVKHLLLQWQEGAAWFADTLVDCDLANNIMGWQWTAGCGADAAPFFRIFNPTAQGRRFDREGIYIRRWVPELSDLPDKYIHQPSAAPEKILAAANLTLDHDYPRPIVEHKFARQRALDALAKVKG